MTVQKSYGLVCDINSESCRHYADSIVSDHISVWSDRDEMLAYHQKRGWRTVAGRDPESGSIRLKDVCPDCVPVTPGAV